MDGILVSSNEHLAKPDPKIYARLCEKFDLVPEECFFIDDMPENVKAAKEYGMEAIVFQNGSELPAALQANRILI